MPAAAASVEHGLRISIFETLGAVEAPWRAFERDADGTAFQAFDWLAAWDRHVGPHHHATPAIVTGHDARGTLVFLLPLAVEPQGGIRRLTFLGDDLCDYNAPLLAPHFADVVPRGAFPAIWDAVRRLLQQRPALRHDAVELTKMPERVGTQINPFLELKVEPNPCAAYLARLGRDWESFYTGKRSSATRRRDRTKRNRLAQQGEVRLVTSGAGDDAARTMQALMQQKRRSLARMGVRDIFERPGHRDFYLALAADPALQDLVHTSRLEIGDEIGAANFGLTFHGCYYHVLASYTDGPAARFGPGSQHLRDLLRYAIERGLDLFDFTIGDEGYKREWSDETLRLFDHAAVATWRGWPAMVAFACVRRPVRLIKQNPRLHRLALALRAAVRGRAESEPAD